MAKISGVSWLFCENNDRPLVDYGHLSLLSGDKLSMYNIHLSIDLIHSRVLFQERERIVPANHTESEKRLWEAADELRANSKLKLSEYSVPVLGFIFLRYADQKFAEAEKKLTRAG